MSENRSSVRYSKHSLRTVQMNLKIPLNFENLLDTRNFENNRKHIHCFARKFRSSCCFCRLHHAPYHTTFCAIIPRGVKCALYFSARLLGSHKDSVQKTRSPYITGGNKEKRSHPPTHTEARTAHSKFAGLTKQTT